VVETPWGFESPRPHLPMKLLNVPVPEMLVASYLVPLPSAMTEAQIRRRMAEAVNTRLSDPLRAMILDSIAQESVIIEVAEAADLPQPLPDQLAPDASVYAVVSAASPASLIAVHEWKARGPAAAFATSIDARLIDSITLEVLDAQEALASLPTASLSGPPGRDITFGFSLRAWLRFRAIAEHDRYWVVTEGMWRFGLPEFAMGGGGRDLRRELQDVLLALAFKIFAGLVGRAQATPEAQGLMKLPQSVRVPAEMTIGREDLDRARGVPNRGGTWTTIALRLHSPAQGRPCLTVCPPAGWDMGLDDFIENVCHALFAFEKPPWHYLPHLGALVTALESIPEARRRFSDGELPRGARFLVRHRTSGEDGFRWAQVESWAEDDAAMVLDSGRELSPPVAPGAVRSLQADLIFDWAVWVDGDGVVEGARTEGIGRGF
jgi:hypothetical protein